MKFTNGYWLYRDGVSPYGAVDVRAVDVEPSRVIVYVAPFEVYNRGQTLAGPLLTIEFTSPHQDILGVKAYHFKGTVKKSNQFPIVSCEQPLTVIQDEGVVRISCGRLTAVLTCRPFKLEYYYDDKFLTRSDTKQLAYLQTKTVPHFRERLHLSVGENIYGLGERFTAFVKNGQSVDIWNEDGGTASDLSYKNIPLYLSNRGYGVFVNHSSMVSFEVGSEAVSKVQFSVEGECLNYYVIGGDNMRTVLANYTDLTGKPSLPPAWSFGLWLSTSFTTKYDEETVNHFVDGMLDRDIPLSVFHFDCFWMKEYEWCNFTWDSSQFPDVAAMLSRLKAKGLKICVWINPYIGQKSHLFDEGMKNGFLLKNLEGGVWQWDLWQPGMALVDFTNPLAVKWYQNHLSKLLDLGVDCFKTDFGERIPLDVIYHDGSDPASAHNYYTYLYNEAVFNIIGKKRGSDAVLFARSATVGCQKFPVHWGGDCEATYESMAESLRGGLSLALGGFGFWSHDIGGFESTASPDVYKRWIAFGLLSTHSRLHGSSSYRVPWLFDEESVDVLRHFVKLKHRLMPYLFSSACVTAKTGVPVMRPMVLEFSNDITCGYLDRQYMLGTSLLVAPVFSSDGTAEVYIPEGCYTHLLTGEVIDGRQFISSTNDFFTLPLWVRPNSIIAMGSTSDSAVYDYTDGLEMHLYEIDDASTEIYDNEGNMRAIINAKLIDGKIEVSVDGDIPMPSFVSHSALPVVIAAK